MKILTETIFLFQLATASNRGPLNETETQLNSTNFVTSDDYNIVKDGSDDVNDDVINDDGQSRATSNDVDIKLKDDDSLSPGKGYQAPPQLRSSPLLKALTSFGQKPT